MISAQAIILLFSSLMISGHGDAGILLPDSEKVILAKAGEALKEQVSAEYIRFSLQARWIPGSLRTLSAEQIISVQPAGPIKKYSSFEVIYSEYGKRSRAEIQLHIKTEQKLPVLSVRKLRGEKITQEDLIWRWVSIDLNRDEPIKNFAVLTGKTLRRTLNAGQFMTTKDIGRAFLIEAGDNISMIYRENSLEISLGCESRQDGATNEEIQVYCKETRKKYLAKIIGPGETEWLKTH